MSIEESFLRRFATGVHGDPAGQRPAVAPACFHGDWDHHNGLKNGLAQNCRVVDRPVAALIHDLRRRGLLESTLVVHEDPVAVVFVARRGGAGRKH